MRTFDFLFGKKKELIKNGADVNTVDKNGRTALMFATIEGRTDIVKELIKNGVDVNAVNEWGTTALAFATIEGHTDL